MEPPSFLRFLQRMGSRLPMQSGAGWLMCPVILERRKACSLLPKGYTRLFGMEPPSFLRFLQRMGSRLPMQSGAGWLMCPVILERRKACSLLPNYSGAITSSNIHNFSPHSLLEQFELQRPNAHKADLCLQRQKHAPLSWAIACNFFHFDATMVRTLQKTTSIVMSDSEEIKFLSFVSLFLLTPDISPLSFSSFPSVKRGYTRLFRMEPPSFLRFLQTNG
ncbi:hypothetical protein CDAR_63961 [Caerostris darwini]|uniref:Uncharacterized protein n=1 Tax=Caerostris darwini TaxID=1538125 RepID=A0AAV4PNQ4_9ARAC|nr:hypothetical protein CDAR_63961 [Caerostris darwini]